MKIDLGVGGRWVSKLSLIFGVSFPSEVSGDFFYLLCWKPFTEQILKFLISFQKIFSSQMRLIFFRNAGKLINLFLQKA